MLAVFFLQILKFFKVIFQGNIISCCQNFWSRKIINEERKKKKKKKKRENILFKLSLFFSKNNFRKSRKIILSKTY
jgi:hypothetical protein